VGSFTMKTAPDLASVARGTPESDRQRARDRTAPCLEPQHEEERHQPAVYPVAKIERDTSPADVDRERRPPERVVGRGVDVDPHERSYRRRGAVR
jgi:hypothetical protein